MLRSGLYASLALTAACRGRSETAIVPPMAVIGSRCGAPCRPDRFGRSLVRVPPGVAEVPRAGLSRRQAPPSSAAESGLRRWSPGLPLGTGPGTGVDGDRFRYIIPLLCYPRFPRPFGRSGGQRAP